MLQRVRSRSPRPKNVGIGLIGAVLVVLGGCSSDATGPQATLGVYQMQTFRGESLPAYSTDGVLYVRSGTLALRSANRFTLDLDTEYCREDACDPNPISYEGAFSTRDGFFTLQTADGPLRGRFFNDYLTVEDDTPNSVWILVES